MDTLVGAPQVKLIFLNIKDAGDPTEIDDLTKLNGGTVSSIATFVPNSPVVTPTPQVYTKQSLIATLDLLLNQFQPTVVRTQQPSDMPAAAVDADGRVVLTTLGTDGRLEVQTQRAAGAALTFSGRQSVG
jgi:hypothetical protein